MGATDESDGAIQDGTVDRFWAATGAAAEPRATASTDKLRGRIALDVRRSQRPETTNG